MLAEVAAKWDLETQEILGKRKYHAVIGPAGENMVLYAGIVSNERIAARTGVGAVMGSKRLKAVSASGSHKLEMDDEEAFKEYTKFIRDHFRDHPMLGIPTDPRPRSRNPTRPFGKWSSTCRRPCS